MKNLLSLEGRRNMVILFITLVVALCSIVYELIFSQALTVVFGGTVTRYSITIGLYLFSLGIGALLFGLLNKKKLFQYFLFIELILSFSGILGVLLIIWLNGSHFEWSYSEWGQSLLVVISHLPVVFVGILSGLEIPILSHFMVARKNAFSEVLGFDYIGSLLGTVIYALCLYPFLGLINTVIVIGALNLLVAFVFFWLYESKANRTKVQHACVWTAVSCFAVLFFFSGDISEKTTKFFMSAKIQDRFWSFEAPLEKVHISKFFQTPYQAVTLFETEYANPEEIPNDHCLNLDTHIQMCDDWYLSYHHGLVDVPMGLFKDDQLVDVLLIGGGDFIAHNHLKNYNVNLTQVDIDQAFMDFAKEHPYLTSKNQRAYEYFPDLEVHATDAFKFLQQNRTKFDLILVDLPGMENDRLLHLYSQEFYGFAAKALKPDGFLVSWVYPEKPNTSEHRSVLFETLKTAGFSQRFAFRALKNRSSVTESFHVLSMSQQSLPALDLEKNPYLVAYADYYKKNDWEPLPNSLVRSNSVFRPNYDIIVKLPYLPKPEPVEI